MSVEVHDYRSSAETLEPLKAVDFVAVIGITAAGKTTLIDRAVNEYPDEIHLVLPTTSRTLRSNERQDVDIHTRSEAEMLERIARGGYVQVAPRVFGPLYATAPEDFATDKICVAPIIPEAIPDFETLPFLSFRQVYILPPSQAAWQQRRAERRFDAEQERRRLAEARRSLQYALGHDNLAFIINDDVDTAADELVDFLRHGHSQVTATDGRRLAENLLSYLL